MLQFIITRAGDASAITVVLKNKPVTVPSTDPAYAELVELLKLPDSTEEAVEAVVFKKAQEVERAIFGEGDFTLAHGVVAYKGLSLPQVLSERLLSMAEEGFDVSPLKSFAENLALNPSHRVFQQLYGFLDYGKMALTPDGCFLAYKKVRSDWKDIHSNTFDNSVGQRLEMPRLLVDDTPGNTCSSGLHVCSYDYLPHFGGSVEDGFHVVTCKVNPKDVVSVPTDYHNTKMRVCAYEVIGVVDDYVKANDNVLAGASVSNGRDFATFIIEVKSVDEDSDDGDEDTAEFRHDRSFSRLRDAVSYFEEVCERAETDDDLIDVRLVNGETGEVLDELGNS